MLQVPQTSERRAPIALRRAAKKAAPRKSAVDAAIAEYYSARRAEGVTKRRLDRLVKKHPDLEHRLPLVYICTRASTGEKVYGRSLCDYNRVYPESLDHISPGNVAGRARFEAEMKKARPDHHKLRVEAGIEKLDNEHGKAGGRTFRAFQAILRLQPTTARDFGSLSRFILKELPVECDGKIWNTHAADTEDYEYRRLRRSLALASIEVVLRSWAKR